MGRRVYLCKGLGAALAVRKEPMPLWKQGASSPVVPNPLGCLQAFQGCYGVHGRDHLPFGSAANATWAVAGEASSTYSPSNIVGGLLPGALQPGTIPKAHPDLSLSAGAIPVRR